MRRSTCQATSLVSGRPSAPQQAIRPLLGALRVTSPAPSRRAVRGAGWAGPLASVPGGGAVGRSGEAGAGGRGQEAGGRRRRTWRARRRGGPSPQATRWERPRAQTRTLGSNRRMVTITTQGPQGQDGVSHNGRAARVKSAQIGRKARLAPVPGVAVRLSGRPGQGTTRRSRPRRWRQNPIRAPGSPSSPRPGRRGSCRAQRPSGWWLP